MHPRQEQLYAAYHDPEFFERENDTLFACTWVNTGSSNRIANTADANPVTVAGLQ